MGQFWLSDIKLFKLAHGRRRRQGAQRSRRSRTASKARKKLVVAGPGAGKTTLFRKLLDSADGTADQRLVLTFINNLKADLEGSLGDALVSSPFTAIASICCTATAASVTV